MASTWLDWLFHQLVIHRLLPKHTCGDFKLPIVICDVRPSDFGMIMEDWSQRPFRNVQGQRMAQPPARNGMKMVLDVLIKCTMATIIALSWEELGEHIFHHHPCVLSSWMLSVHLSVWLTLLMRCVLILFVPFDGGITSFATISYVWWLSLCF